MRSVLVSVLASITLNRLPTSSASQTYDEEVHRGIDADACAASFAPLADARLLDHEMAAISEYENKSAFVQRCQHSLKHAIWQEQRSLHPYLFADSLDDVRIAERASASEPRIVYFIMASRGDGAIIVSRLILALYHPSHIFLIHVDLKAETELFEKLSKLSSSHSNIHLMETRRQVQWGGWSMVATMLDAIKSISARDLDYDFFINLSDADMALRTNEEILGFLSRYKGRQFVQVHQGTGEWLERARNFTRAHAVVECAGYGFVSINGSVMDLGEGGVGGGVGEGRGGAAGGGDARVCCFGRSGPVVYANESRLHLPALRRALEQEARSTADGQGEENRIHTGSQWVILHKVRAKALLI